MVNLDFDLALLEGDDGTLFLNCYSKDEEGAMRRETLARGLPDGPALCRSVDRANNAVARAKRAVADLMALASALQKEEPDETHPA